MYKKCTHDKDKLWTTDLLWYYTHHAILDLTNNKYTKSWFDPWYGKLDPKSLKDDRHEVYNLLIEPKKKPLNYEESKVPWNQTNPSFDKHMKKKRFKGLNCGPAVKIFACKFMQVVNYPSKSLIKDGGMVACESIKRTLGRYWPVLIGLGHKKTTHVSHYVAIVGHKRDKGIDHFLILEPWGGFGEIDYGYCEDGSRGKTRYLGVLKYDTVNDRVVYIGKGGIPDYHILTY